MVGAEAAGREDDATLDGAGPETEAGALSPIAAVAQRGARRTPGVLVPLMRRCAPAVLWDVIGAQTGRVGSVGVVGAAACFGRVVVEIREQ